MLIVFASQLPVVLRFLISKNENSKQIVINVKRFPYLCLILHYK
jgi:hypothetical protein